MTLEDVLRELRDNKSYLPDTQNPFNQIFFDTRKTLIRGGISDRPNIATTALGINPDDFGLYDKLLPSVDTALRDAFCLFGPSLEQPGKLDPIPVEILRGYDSLTPPERGSYTASEMRHFFDFNQSALPCNFDCSSGIDDAQLTQYAGRDIGISPEIVKAFNEAGFSDPNKIVDLWKTISERQNGAANIRRIRRLTIEALDIVNKFQSARGNEYKAENLFAHGFNEYRPCDGYNAGFNLHQMNNIFDLLDKSYESFKNRSSLLKYFSEEGKPHYHGNLDAFMKFSKNHIILRHLKRCNENGIYSPQQVIELDRLGILVHELPEARGIAPEIYPQMLIDYYNCKDARIPLVAFARCLRAGKRDPKQMSLMNQTLNQVKDIGSDCRVTPVDLFALDDRTHTIAQRFPYLFDHSSSFKELEISEFSEDDVRWCYDKLKEEGIPDNEVKGKVEHALRARITRSIYEQMTSTAKDDYTLKEILGTFDYFRDFVYMDFTDEETREEFESNLRYDYGTRAWLFQTFPKDVVFDAFSRSINNALFYAELNEGQKSITAENPPVEEFRRYMELEPASF